MPAAITAVGTIDLASGSGLTTIDIVSTTAGNCLVLYAHAPGSSSRTVTGVSGGGCDDWQKLAGPINATGSTTVTEVWFATVDTAGASTITVTWSSSVAGQTCRYGVQEFTSGGGVGTQWIQDGAGGTRDNSSSTTITWPTLVPSGAARLYVGRALLQNTGLTTGATAGYVVQLDGANNQFIYHLSVSTSQSPTSQQNTAGYSAPAAGLIFAENNPARLNKRSNNRARLIRASNF